MIYYTVMDSQDYGLLTFKVIGAASKEAAQEATIKNWYDSDSLRQGETLEGSPTICPLFGDLAQSRDFGV